MREAVQDRLGFRTSSGADVRVPRTPFKSRHTSGDAHGLAERLYRQLKFADLRVRAAEQKVRKWRSRLEFDGVQAGGDGSIVVARLEQDVREERVDDG